MRQIFASSPGWNWSGPMSTHRRTPFTRSPMPGNRGQEQQADACDAEEVAVRLEDAVVVAEPDQRPAERRDADGDPERLPAAVVGVEAVDRREPERGQHGGQREERAVRVRNGSPHHDVGGEVEPEEERAPGERARRDLRVAGDRDARERDASEEPGDDEPGELAAAGAHRVMPQ